MQNRIFKVLLTTVFLLFSFCGYGQCEAKIKDFYVAYMQNAEGCNDQENIKLLNTCMSQELIAKLEAYTRKYDVDAIVHAQDVSAYGIRSLIVVALKENRYLVKYKWNPQSEYTCIPVKATDVDGKFTILDIAPIDIDVESYINYD